jgi:hypothetical protein
MDFVLIYQRLDLIYTATSELGLGFLPYRAGGSLGGRSRGPLLAGAIHVATAAATHTSPFASRRATAANRLPNRARAQSVAYLGPTGQRGMGQRGSNLIRTSCEHLPEDLGPTYSISKNRD